MSDYISTEHPVKPYFDIELFMSLCQETRIEGTLMDTCIELWDKWLPALHAKNVKIDTLSYLVVWLDEAVEEDVDNTWDESPSEAFLINALAQTMCMTAVHELVPEVEDVGCAPAPKVTERLKVALAAEGIPYENEDGTSLSRRYAVVTWYPFKGGCEICSMQSMCPKAAGSGPSSVVLPGFEKE